MNRGCGTRMPGGVYLVVPMGPDGAPLEHFLFCPAIPLPPEWNVSPRGQQIVPFASRNCVVDWIGENNYPNVSDFIEEGRCHGFSRHVSPELAARVEPGARLLPVHARGLIRNWSLYAPRTMDMCPRQLHPVNELAGYSDREMEWFEDFYPRAIADHTRAHYPHAGCSGYWWEDIEGGTVIDAKALLGEHGYVERTIGDTTYTGFARLPWIEPDYEPAIFAMLPIGVIHVIDGAEESADTYRRMRKTAKLPVQLMEE